MTRNDSGDVSKPGAGRASSPREASGPRRLRRRQVLAGAAAVSLGFAAPPLLRAARDRIPREDPIPWLADIQRPPETLPPDAPRLASLLVARDGTTIRTATAWEARRGEVRRWWLDFLGDLGVERAAPPRVTVLSEEPVDGVVRRLVRYEVEPGVATEAYLLEPARAAGAPRGAARLPGAVVFHSTVGHSILQPAGVKGVPEKAFGLALARRGFVALCPRNFLWPENRRLEAQAETGRFRARHPGVRGMARMLHDARVALDILASHPRVDPQRLAAVGHSLGAKEVLYLAAFDERVVAAAASEGGVGLRFSNWNAPWYLGPEIDRPEFRESGRDHHELLALVAPRAFLLAGGESADGDRSWPFVERALEVYRLLAPESGRAARPAIGLLNHRLGHQVPRPAGERILEWIEAFTPARGASAPVRGGGRTSGERQP